MCSTYLDVKSQNIYLSLPSQVNEWQSDWVSFYSQQKLEHQLNMVEKSYGDREARELWANLQVHLFFDLIGNIKHPILSVI